MIALWLLTGLVASSEAVEPPVTVTPQAEVNWPSVNQDRQRAELFAALLKQAEQRGKKWIEQNKTEVRRSIKRTIARELKAEGLLTDAIIAQVAPMVSDAINSVPMLDLGALQRQLEQFDLIIWQQAERLAEEHRLAIMADDEEAIFVLMAAA